ncbi:MAG: hypothetical protein P8P88_00970, partial [Polaribacter sp.]|nr:hypothetical protein [Polaribacter sp.]
MKNLLQKILFILFIAFVSCQEEQIIETTDSDQNITTDSIIFGKLSDVSIDDTIKCTNFVYPLSFSIYDSNNQVLRNESVNNDEELNDLLSSIENSDFDGSFIELNYPLSLVNTEGETITVYSNQELVEALSTENNCEDFINNLFTCVFGLFQFDINIIDSDTNPNDGITSFSLEIDLDCNGIEYDLTYFETQSDAEANVNNIVFPYTNTSNPQKLYVRAETNYINQTYNEVFEVNINVAAEQANDVCPGDYASGFLTQCKWNITNHNSIDYSDYSFSFRDDGTFTAENTSDNTSQEGTWLAADNSNGIGSFIRL